jgi:hypothetical protein
MHQVSLEPQIDYRLTDAAIIDFLAIVELTSPGIACGVEVGYPLEQDLDCSMDMLS